MALNPQVTSALVALNTIILPLQVIEPELRRLTSENESLKLKNEQLKLRGSVGSHENNELRKQIQALMKTNEALKQKNKKLKKHNVDVTLKNLELHSQIAKLQERDVASNDKSNDHSAPSATSRPENDVIVELRQEVKKLKARLMFVAPLIKCAISIRQRTFEQSRVHLGFGKANAAVVARGDAAAHHGDFLADNAMVALMPDVPGDGRDTSYFMTKENARKMMSKLYDCGGFTAAPLPSPLLLASLNITASIISISTYRLGKEDNQDVGLQQFAILRKQNLAIISGLLERHKVENREPGEFKIMMDECPDMRNNVEEMNVEEMNVVWKRCLQRRKFLKRWTDYGD